MDGDQLSVVGVAYIDVLNVRELPGTDQEIVATADPTATDLIATGRAQLLPASLWFEVEVDGVVGWAGSAFLAHAGAADDATAEYRAGVDPVESAGTVEELGALVAASFASEDPESSIVQVSQVASADLSDVMFDVIGLGDDAVGGFRLHIFAEPVDGDEVALRTIERLTLCSRGVSDDGLCR